MELNKVSLEQWHDIENFIQLVETHWLTQEVAFQIIEKNAARLQRIWV